MMVRTLGVMALAGLAVVTCNADVWGQGRGNGLNRAAQAGGRSPATAPPGTGFNRAGNGNQGQGHQGMNRVDPNLARGNAGTSRGAAARSPSSSGLAHGVKTPGSSRSLDSASAGTRAQQNPERIRDQRLEQADHLRQVAEKNGNERLRTTADRMQANAEQQYVRQAGNVTQPGASNNALPAGNVGDPSGEAASPGAPANIGPPATSPPSAPGKPSWLPSWLRGRSAK